MTETKRGAVERRETFCQSYVRHGNATRAAKEAGYSEKTAYAQGHRLLNKAEIIERVATIRSDRWKALHMSDDELLAEAARLARFNIGRITHITPDGDPYIDLSMATEDDFAAITELAIEDFTDGRGDDARDVRRVKVKAPNKLAAVNLLMKQRGMLVEKMDVNMTGDFAGAMEKALRRARKGGGDGDQG